MISNSNIKDFFNLPCHVYIKDKKGVYKESNDYLALNVGLTKGDEIIGAKDFDFCPPQCASTYLVNDQITIVKEATQIFSEEIAYVNKPNTTCVSYKTPLILKNGKVDGVIGLSFLLSDITEEDVWNENPLAKLLLTFTNNNLIKQELTQEQTNLIASLTAKQRQVFFQVLQGKTAKEIANHLNLSKRTIEAHIDMIKLRMNCYNKRNLISKFSNVKY